MAKTTRREATDDRGSEKLGFGRSRTAENDPKKHPWVSREDPIGLHFLLRLGPLLAAQVGPSQPLGVY